MTRLLGIDPGTKRCGIAVTDSAQTMAFPREALDAGIGLLEELASIIDDEAISAVVVGRPVALSGNETSSTVVADELYSSIVRRFTQLRVVQHDERLTTYEAQKSLSQAGLKSREHRARIDSAAAVIMLQNYVDGLHAD